MPHTRIIPTKPALILKGEKKNLIISDIHIGFESAMAANNIFLGKNSTINQTIQEVSDIIDTEEPDSLVLLGDVKSTIHGISKNEWDEVPRFLDAMKAKCDVVLIPGNHDANIQRLIPDGITTISQTGMVQDNILLTHGHTMPPEAVSHVSGIIMGHLHPVFFQKDSVINGQRVWVSIQAQKDLIFPNRSGLLEIIIVPSFNRYFYATHMNKRKKKSTAPVISRLNNINTVATSAIKARIVTLDGTIIGNESVINQVF